MKLARKMLLAVGVIAACGFVTLQVSHSEEAKEAKEMKEDAGVEYMVTFSGMWTAMTHPLEYPKGTIITGAHFSKVIGATHGDGLDIFKMGMMPTTGLEKLSETGKTSPLDEEIKAAITAGTAMSMIEFGPLKDLSETTSAKFKIWAKQPMVSLVTMIAPSPDWFAGVSRVNLMEHGKWVSKKTVEVFAWDSGGDDGATYKTDDKDNNPKKPTMINDSAHFIVKDARVPVAQLVFTKQ